MINLMRQKLSSSHGRKHFIVAYNLCETLKENRLELECQDYSKMREFIADISKKKFEIRSNNLLKKNELDLCKEDLEVVSKRFQL